LSIRIRFAFEGDELDAQIQRGQYGFWASHCEAVMPDGAGIRYDDEVEGWYPTRAEDSWLRQLTVDIPATRVQAQKFYVFLGHQIGKPYDMRGLAGVQCHVEHHKQDRWSCAHLLYAALLAAGILRSAPRELFKVTVRDLMIAIGALVELPEPEERPRASVS